MPKPILRIFSKSGEERWIGHVCGSVFSSDGRNLGRRASNRNMTRYKQAEEKLHLASQLRPSASGGRRNIGGRNSS